MEKPQPVKDRNLIYDVGMHKGEDTDYYLKKGFKVIAFEADPDLIAYCKNRFANEIEKGSLRIVEGAIVEFSPAEQEPKKYIYFFKNSNSVWGTVVDDWAKRNESLGTSNEVIEVPTIDFADCIKNYGIPYYLKIDIEGMDTVCLKALMEFDSKPDYISIESEKVSFAKLKEEFVLFAKLGYTTFQAINQATIPLQKEPLHSKEGIHLGFEFQKGASGLFGSDLSTEWKDENQILKKYKRIFLGYKLFGDRGKLIQYRFGKSLLRYLNKYSKEPIPGWYDTHARHSSATLFF